MKMNKKKAKKLLKNNLTMECDASEFGNKTENENNY